MSDFITYHINIIILFIIRHNFRAHEAPTHGFLPAFHSGRISLVFSSDSYCETNTQGAVYLLRLSPLSDNSNSGNTDIFTLPSISENKELYPVPVLTLDTILLEI